MILSTKKQSNHMDNKILCGLMTANLGAMQVQLWHSR